MIRKTLHLLVAFVPMLASIDAEATMLLLASGTLFYIFAEKLRLQGGTVIVVSDLTVLASRNRHQNRFILGPVTLGLGAMLALLLYPEPAATVAIYALAFGDGFASFIGRLYGRFKIPFTGGKTLVGSLACFAGVFLSTFRLLGSMKSALIVAVAATVLEVLPTDDFDNLILPTGTGLVAMHLLGPF